MCVSTLRIASFTFRISLNYWIVRIESTYEAQSSITFNRCVADSNLLIWAVAMVTDTEFTSREKIRVSFQFDYMYLIYCLAHDFLQLTNKEASTLLCSVVKHAGSGRARKKFRGKHET